MTRITARRVSYMAVLGAVALVAAACGGNSSKSTAAATGSTAPGAPAAASSPKSGGSLSIGVEAVWHPIDPLDATTFTDHDVSMAVLAPLFDLGPGGTLQPDLATGYTAQNGNKTYVITLRKNVTFQDGTPFNAQAVVFNLERDANPANACKCLVDLKDLSSVVATDPTTVTVNLTHPDSTFPSLMADSPGMMASPTALQQEGKGFGLHPVGAGPFKFVSEVANSSITLAKWPGYWNAPKPYLDSVTFKVIPDVSTRLASLQSGAIQDDEDIEPTEISTVQSASNLKVESLGGVGTFFVEFQNQRAPLDNVLARRAVTYATNPQVINTALFAGKATTGIESPWTPQSWAYPGPNVAGYPAYDLAKAKQLVQQLGGLSFTLSIRNDATSVAIGQALQSEWAAAGIKVQLNELQNLALVKDSQTGKYQAMLYRWAGNYEPDGNVSTFFRSGSPLNSVKLNDPVVDQLLTQEREAATQAARKPIFQSLAVQLAKDIPEEFLFAADWWRASVSSLHGIPKLANNWMELQGAWLS